LGTAVIAKLIYLCVPTVYIIIIVTLIHKSNFVTIVLMKSNDKIPKLVEIYESLKANGKLFCHSHSLNL